MNLLQLSKRCRKPLLVPRVTCRAFAGITGSAPAPGAAPAAGLRADRRTPSARRRRSGPDPESASAAGERGRAAESAAGHAPETARDRGQAHTARTTHASAPLRSCVTLSVSPLLTGAPGVGTGDAPAAESAGGARAGAAGGGQHPSHASYTISTRPTQRFHSVWALGLVTLKKIRCRNSFYSKYDLFSV